MMNTRIEALRNEYIELRDYLKDNGQITFEININNAYKKSLILSIASYYESALTDIVLDYAKRISNSDIKILSFIENKALQRQYHSLFDWDSNNTNRFLKLFGTSAKENARHLLDENNLLDAEKAFLEIGRERNKLVHNNYVEAVIDSTFDEIYNRYVEANKYIKFIQTSFLAAAV